MAGINVGMLKSIEIQLPPLALQQKFAALVERVERLRAVQRESLRQAEHLFASLLAHEFRPLESRLQAESADRLKAGLQQLYLIWRPRQ